MTLVRCHHCQPLPCLRLPCLPRQLSYGAGRWQQAGGPIFRDGNCPPGPSTPAFDLSTSPPPLRKAEPMTTPKLPDPTDGDNPRLAAAVAERLHAVGLDDVKAARL